MIRLDPMRPTHAAAAAAASAATALLHASTLPPPDWARPGAVSDAAYQYVLFGAMRVAGWRARRRLERSCVAFEASQRDTLRELLRESEGSQFDMDRAVSAALSSDDVVAAFRTSQPLTTYGTFAELLRKRLAERRASANQQ